MKNKFSFLNILLIGWLLLNIVIIIYQGNNPNIKIITNEAKKDNNLISMLVEQSDGTYQENKENAWNNDKYVFNEKLSGCEQGSKLSYDGEKVKVTTNKSDKCYVYFNYVKLNDYLIKLHTSEGANQIYYHDGQGEYPNSNLEAGDFSYRYSGSSETVKNYVCLDGTTAKGTCNSDADLYRIIGLFSNEEGEYEAKLIKAIEGTTKELGDSTTAKGGSYAVDEYYQWNSTNGNSSNMWQYSNLNKINLNTFYLNYLTNKVKGIGNHITKHKWITGGLPFLKTNAQQIYNNELGSEKLTTNDVKCYSEMDNKVAVKCTEEDLTHQAKIGLMYVTDYGYAAYPEAWVTPLYNYNQSNITDNNWIFTGRGNWTISRRYERDYDRGGEVAWGYNNMGVSGGDMSIFNKQNVVRPSFYLDTSTKLASGDGTKINPYRLVLK